MARMSQVMIKELPEYIYMYILTYFALSYNDFSRIDKLLTFKIIILNYIYYKMIFSNWNFLCAMLEREREKERDFIKIL